MPSVLLTAYGPYDDWQTNVSQLVLEQVQAAAPDRHELTCRVYPVDFSVIREHIAGDLQANPDFAIHMGQAPGYAAVTFESLGINVAVRRRQAVHEGVPLVPGGAAAYQSQLPLATWVDGLQRQGVPAAVSYHAGTYLCNAALYLSRHEADTKGLPTQSVFLHLPMATEQVTELRTSLPSLPLAALTSAVRWILEQL